LAQYEFDIRDYWRIIKKRTAIILLSILLITSFSFVFAKLRAPVPLYRTSARVRFEKSTSISGLFIKAISWSAWDDLATQMNVITSFDVMERAAKELGLIDRGIPGEKIKKSSQLLQIVNSLERSLETEQVGNTNIIRIIAESTDPKMAQRMANTAARAYREHNIREMNRRSLEATNFIEKQVKIVGDRLRGAEEKVRRFRQENKIISFGEQTRTSLRQVVSSEAEYESIKARIKRIGEEIKLAEAGKLVYSGEGRIPAPSAGTGRSERGGAFGPSGTESQQHYSLIESASPSVARLNRQIADLQVTRTILLLNLTPSHPKVNEIDLKIGGLRRQVMGELRAERKGLRNKKLEIEYRLREVQAKSGQVPEVALNLARLEREVQVNSELYSLLRSRHQEALIQLSEQIEEVSIIAPALTPTVPINPPQTIPKTIIGFIIGVIVGLMFVFTTETLDTSIGTIEDVEEYLNVPVVGIIPHFEAEELRRLLSKKEVPITPGLEESYTDLVTHFYPKAVVSEAFRSLRTNLEFLRFEKKGKVFILTSSSIREGKTLNVVNLAISLAQSGHKTLLVEGDLRRPTIHMKFGLEREPGLIDVILGRNKIDEAIRTVTDILMGKFSMDDVMRTPGLDKLNILTAGASPPNPSEILGSPQMLELLNSLREKYEYVILDMPPVLPVADASIIGPKVDGVLLIYQVGKVARGVLKRAKVQLDNVKAEVFGVVLNNVKAEVGPDYYKYQMRNYYGEQAPKISKVKSSKDWILGGISKVLHLVKREKAEPSEKPDKKTEPAKKKVRVRLKILILLIALLLLILALLIQYGLFSFPFGFRKQIDTTTVRKAIDGFVQEADPNQDRLGNEPAQRKDAPAGKGSETPNTPEDGKTSEMSLLGLSMVHAALSEEQQAYLPFSILVPGTMDERQILLAKRKGASVNQKVFVNTLTTEAGGTNFRVLMGKFRTEQEAEGFLHTHPRLLPGAAVERTPYTCGVGPFRHAAEAGKSAEKLGRLSLYADTENVAGVFWLYVGAFANIEEAVPVASRMKQAGILFKVVRR